MSVIFDQLRISDDGKKLYIDLHVIKTAYFKDVYLDSITIIDANSKERDCSKKEYTGISETSPNVPNDHFIFKCTCKGKSKEASLEISVADLNAAFANVNSSGEAIDSNKPYAKVAFNKKNFSDSLLFVYVTCKGIDSECTPCILDSSRPTIGVTFDDKLLYQRVMGYTKSLANTCKVPTEFVDFILLWNALKASIETEHWLEAIDYWHMLFDTGAYSYTSKGCGCHG